MSPCSGQKPCGRAFCKTPLKGDCDYGYRRKPVNHILYEFSMYLQTLLYRTDNQFVTNLMVDSRMVHMRNIAYFFSSAKAKNKKYLHYFMYINRALPQEINHDLFTEIQKYTSNSTCHLLIGRLKDSFKQETALFEQRAFPLFVSMINSFLNDLNTNISPDFASAWADERIQRNADGTMDLIRTCEQISKESPVFGTTGGEYYV